MTTKPEGGGVKALVVRPLKDPLFLFAASLMILWILFIQLDILQSYNLFKLYLSYIQKWNIKIIRDIFDLVNNTFT